MQAASASGQPAAAGPTKTARHPPVSAALGSQVTIVKEARSAPTAAQNLSNSSIPQKIVGSGDSRLSTSSSRPSRRNDLSLSSRQRGTPHQGQCHSSGNNHNDPLPVADKAINAQFTLEGLLTASSAALANRSRRSSPSIERYRGMTRGSSGKARPGVGYFASSGIDGPSVAPNSNALYGPSVRDGNTKRARSGSSSARDKSFSQNTSRNSYKKAKSCQKAQLPSLLTMNCPPPEPLPSQPPKSHGAFVGALLDSGLEKLRHFVVSGLSAAAAEERGIVEVAPASIPTTGQTDDIKMGDTAQQISLSPSLPAPVLNVSSDSVAPSESGEAHGEISEKNPEKKNSSQIKASAMRAERKKLNKLKTSEMPPSNLPPTMRAASAITGRGKITCHTSFDEHGECIFHKPSIESDPKCNGGKILFFGDQAAAAMASTDIQTNMADIDNHIDYVITNNLTPKDLVAIFYQFRENQRISNVFGDPNELDFQEKHWTDRITDIVICFTTAFEIAVEKGALGEFLTELTFAMSSIKKSLPQLNESRLHFMAPILRPSLSPRLWTAYTTTVDYLSQTTHARLGHALPENLTMLIYNNELLMTGWKRRDSEEILAPHPIIFVPDPAYAAKPHDITKPIGTNTPMTTFEAVAPGRRPQLISNAFNEITRQFNPQTAAEFKLRLCEAINQIAVYRTDNFTVTYYDPVTNLSMITFPHRIAPPPNFLTDIIPPHILSGSSSTAPDASDQNLTPDNSILAQTTATPNSTFSPALSSSRHIPFDLTVHNNPHFTVTFSERMELSLIHI